MRATQAGDVDTVLSLIMDNAVFLVAGWAAGAEYNFPNA
jgi:ketosteroid isomerase-like protein